MTRAEAKSAIIAGEYEDVLDAVERGDRDAVEKDGWWKEAVRCLDRAEKAEKIVAVLDVIHDWTHCPNTRDYAGTYQEAREDCRVLWHAIVPAVEEGKC